MKKRLIAIFYIISIGICFAMAENQSTFIRGRIVDDKGKAVESAVVAWLSIPEKLMIANALSDNTGYFVAETEKEVGDSSMAVISCIGYKTDTIFVYKNKYINVYLQENVHHLSGVTITQKSTLKGTPGGFMFKPGGTEMLLPDAYSVLRVTPTINITSTSIEILGKGNAIIHINGRDPHLSDYMVIQMLRQVPPKDIERIDVISEVGSSQSSADKRGIVNIVMKRPDYGWDKSR